MLLEVHFATNLDRQDQVLANLQHQRLIIIPCTKAEARHLHRGGRAICRCRCALLLSRPLCGCQLPLALDYNVVILGLLRGLHQRGMPKRLSTCSPPRPPPLLQSEVLVQKQSQQSWAAAPARNLTCRRRHPLAAAAACVLAFLQQVSTSLAASTFPAWWHL